MNTKMQEAGRLGGIATAKTLKLQKAQRIAEYDRSPKLCHTCRSPILYSKRGNKYCNHSCAAKTSNLARISNKRLCIVCQAELPATAKKYCSNNCQWSSKQKRIDAAIENGDIIHCLTVKRYLLRTKGHICSICNITEWCGYPVPLIMDHINGHSDDNSICNLRLVCGNCDMQLPTYKSRNKGNGRHTRMMRYNAGKSY